ncbi:MAG TPA: nucleoside-diphosphate sugar epimerase/dehydratase [Actinomycetota bacterium]|nr:nucleoside-diphosphate sugar epimerase/dehydratase [Actinomycetota bacterium]
MSLRATTPGSRQRARHVGSPSTCRSAVQAALDVLAWAVALAAACLARYDFQVASVVPAGLAAMTALAAVGQAGAGWFSGLYRGRRRFGSFDEVAVLAPATAFVTALLFLADLAPGEARLVPLGATLGGGIGAFVLMGGVRYAWRLRLDRLLRPRGDGATRLLVFGAGEGGVQVITSMLRNPAAPYLPVALLDDHPGKRHLRISGIPVVGTRHSIAQAARDHRATALLIAVPSAGADLVGELTDLANQAGLAVKVLPPVSELLDARVGVGDIRSLTEADLLGRHEIDTDVEAIAGYLTGRRVLVTGAGGSIGSELCRQIDRFAPAELVMVDRDESALHAVQLSIQGRALLDSPDVVLLDIRDRRRLGKVLAERRPEVVFHAAGLKHLPLLEQHPGEAVRTNVLATLDLLELAARWGVDRFVNVSTDKAADPTSVLGWSKRIAERLTTQVARGSSGTFLSVRFGNVLGSRGSVLTTFRAQLAAGGPITVTTPDVTRYFMTVEEAVQLVIQAGAIGRGGEALVLDMGAPVRIASVAERLAAQADHPIEIVYTGLRPGEKLHEVLLGAGERDVRPIHPLISHVEVPPCDPELARRLDPTAPPGAVAGELRRLAAARAPRGEAHEPGRAVTAPEGGR